MHLEDRQMEHMADLRVKQHMIEAAYRQKVISSRDISMLLDITERRASSGGHAMCAISSRPFEGVSSRFWRDWKCMTVHAFSVITIVIGLLQSSTSEQKCVHIAKRYLP